MPSLDRLSLFWCLLCVGVLLLLPALTGDATALIVRP